MENWDQNNLPENHNFFSNITFVALTEGTWKRKKNDGTDEIAPKWDLITQADESGASMQIAIYSATDKEEVKLNTKYDIIAKRSVGKDGTFYGYTLKGFAPAGQPIPKKEPQSRWQKGQKLNAKVEALKCACTILAMRGNDPIVAGVEAVELATMFESWLNGEYKAPEKESADKKKK